MIIRLLIIISLLTTVYSSTHAQGMEFSDITLDEAFVLAEKEGKYVFIDFKTVWCGPCKNMDKNVFPLPAVGDYYNEAFVCLRLDAEREGYETARKYKVSSYPTYLFLDTEGNVVFKETGFHIEEEFIALGKKAVASVNSKYSLEKLRSMYPDKQDDEGFVKLYFKKMIEYGQDPSEGLERWLSIQTEIDPAGKEMLDFLIKYKKYLYIGGMADEILQTNYEAYAALVTTDQEKIMLERLNGFILTRSADRAERTRDVEMYKLFLDRVKEDPDNNANSAKIKEYEMSYYLMSKDYASYKADAALIVAGLMEKNVPEEVKAADKKGYEWHQSKYKENPEPYEKIPVSYYKIKSSTKGLIRTIHEMGLTYLSVSENKDDYKVVKSWVDYLKEVNSDYYQTYDLESEYYYSRGKLDKAIELKKEAIEVWPSYDKKRLPAERRLQDMITEQGQ